MDEIEQLETVVPISSPPPLYSLGAVLVIFRFAHANPLDVLRTPHSRHPSPGIKLGIFRTIHSYRHLWCQIWSHAEIKSGSQSVQVRRSTSNEDIL